MAKILKLTDALATAKADAKAAGAAHKAEPANRILRATYLGALAIVLTSATAITKADPKMKAAMKKVTEKYSEKKERLEETDMEEESAASGASSSEASSAASSAMSSEEEEEESVPASTAKSSEEEEEEEGAAASEEEEEEAIAKGLKAAHAAYLKAAKGTDAYGVFGPKGITKAVLKATGETSIKGALGALAAMPRKAKADAAVAKDVAALKAKNAKDDVEAVVQAAKADGRASSPALRAELRAMGATMGAKYLKGFVAKLPKAGRTSGDGERLPRTDAEGNALGLPDGDAQAVMMERAMAGLDKKDREAFAEIAKDKKRKANGATGRV